jgi:choline monooxygenase
MERTLPWSWYSDPQLLRRETARIFARSWQYAGHTGQVAKSGSYFASWAGEIPIVITRARDGELRAFVNVCRHRGFTVARGEGRRETLQCPYHAWTYGLDGKLRAAPRSEREPEFDADELGLLPAAVDTWGPFVFVNPDANASPLVDALGEVPALSCSSSTRSNTAFVWTGSWTRTGRSPARTSSSVTTVPSRIRASARSSTWRRIRIGCARAD